MGIMSSRNSELRKIAKQFHCRTRVNFKRWVWYESKRHLEIDNY